MDDSAEPIMMREPEPALQRSEHVVFRGEVQGVGFRWTCRRLATALGLRGWVRNLPDGSVEAVLQGEPEQVRSLLQALLNEPGRIRVSETLQRRLELPPIQGFSVR
jgi:acylphosphatase